MKQKFSYSFREMNARLLAIGRPIRKYLVVSTLASVVGSLSHMGLMGFGALWLLSAAGLTGSGGLYAALTALSAALIALSGQYQRTASLEAGMGDHPFFSI